MMSAAAASVADALQSIQRRPNSKQRVFAVRMSALDAHLLTTGYFF
jgi:hypothetical protein